MTSQKICNTWKNILLLYTNSAYFWLQIHFVSVYCVIDFGIHWSESRSKPGPCTANDAI